MSGTGDEAESCIESALKHSSAGAQGVALIEPSTTGVSGHVRMLGAAESMAEDAAVESTHFLQPIRMKGAAEKHLRHEHALSVMYAAASTIRVFCTDDEAGTYIGPARKHSAAGVDIAHEDSSDTGVPLVSVCGTGSKARSRVRREDDDDSCSGGHMRSILAIHAYVCSPMHQCSMHRFSSFGKQLHLCMSRKAYMLNRASGLQPPNLL